MEGNPTAVFVNFVSRFVDFLCLKISVWAAMYFH